MRFILIILIATLSFPSIAQENDVEKVENWFNSLTTAQARFVQTANSGEQSQGTFSLSRPGKLRFEYDDSDDFIVADGAFIYYYDSQIGQQSNALIGSTMADFILRKDFNLRGDLSVTKIKRSGGLLQLTIVQTDDPDAGSLMLAFSEKPFQLKKWRVIDPQGLITEIELFYMKTDIDLPRELFQYHDPNTTRSGYNE